MNDSGKVFVAWESDRNDSTHANADIYCASGNYFGIHEFATFCPQQQMVNIYPNPVRSFLSTNWDKVTIKHIILYDVTGRVVKSYKIENERLAVINCVDLPAGVYFVEFSGSNETIVKKVVKLK